MKDKTTYSLIKSLAKSHVIILRHNLFLIWRSDWMSGSFKVHHKFHDISFFDTTSSLKRELAHSRNILIFFISPHNPFFYWRTNYKSFLWNPITIEDIYENCSSNQLFQGFNIISTYKTKRIAKFTERAKRYLVAW